MDFNLRIFDQIKEKEPLAYKIISNAYNKNNIAHAYIFVGREKNRVTEVLNIFSKLMLCSSGTALDNCISCKMFESGNHPDYRVWEAEKEKSKFIKLEQIHELISATKFQPITSKRKVLILNEIQQLRVEGSNSLLKTLEEPTPFSIILLTVDSLENVLPTIISRCQIIPLKNVEEETNFIDIKPFIPTTYIEASKFSDELAGKEKEEMKLFFINFEKSLWEKAKNQLLQERELKNLSLFFESIENYITCIDSYVNVKVIAENFFIELLDFSKKNQHILKS